MKIYEKSVKPSNEEVIADNTTDSEVSQKRAYTDSTTDSVGMYLDAIAKVALLNAYDEVELSKRIEAGLYAQKVLEASEANQTIDNVSPRSNLTQEELSTLATIASEGELAKNQMIESNLRLVVAFAKRHVNNSGFDVPLIDIIQEGNIGLIRAVEKFDYKQGYKFSTYAAWWIKQFMARGALSQSRLIRLPEWSNINLNKIKMAQCDLRYSLGRDATYKEIAESLNLDADVVKELLVISQTPTSLDAPVAEGEITLGDVIASQETVESFENQIDLFDAKKDLDDTLRRNLSDIEYDVIAYRFGFNGLGPLSITQLAKKLGHSRHFIGKIEKAAMSKLSSLGHLKGLQKYIYE